MEGRHVRACDRPATRLVRYLGDGCYAAFDGFGVWLTAEDGMTATDAVYLEPGVYKELVNFMREAEGRQASGWERP